MSNKQLWLFFLEIRKMIIEVKYNIICYVCIIKSFILGDNGEQPS